MSEYDNPSAITKSQFLEFFYSDAYSELDADECVDIFLHSLKGSDDLTDENLAYLFRDLSKSDGPYANAPELLAACDKFVEHRDCLCEDEDDYKCSWCACVEAIDKVFPNR